jgi:hypothetical protein
VIFSAEVKRAELKLTMMSVCHTSCRAIDHISEIVCTESFLGILSREDKAPQNQGNLRKNLLITSTGSVQSVHRNMAGCW